MIWVWNLGRNFCCKYFHCKIILVKLKHDLWKLLIFADRSENETIDFFSLNIEQFPICNSVISLLNKHIVLGLSCKLESYWILCTEVNHHSKAKKIIATTSTTKKEWLAILDYMQYTWVIDVIIKSIFLQKDYYTYQINWMEFFSWYIEEYIDYNWNRIRIMILHLSLVNTARFLFW